MTVSIRNVLLYLVVGLSSVTLSNCFQHFSIPTKLRHSAATRLFVVSPTSKHRLFDPKYRPPNPVDVKAFNEPVTFDEVGENVLKVAGGELSDQDCNLLCWRCLGYKYNESSETFDNENVMNRWKVLYPQPVDLIGVFNTTDKKAERPVNIACRELWKIIQGEAYQEGLLELPGFTSPDLKTITKNGIRRLMIASWLIFFAGELIDKTPAQIEVDWEARRKQINDEKNKVQRALKKYARESKRFRIEPPAPDAVKKPNRSQREPIGIDKRDRRDANGM